MSSCGAGGQFVISVHCLLKSKRFGRDSRFMFNKFLGALAVNLGSGSSDGGLWSTAVCSLHGCCGNSFSHLARSSGLLCALVWCCVFDGRQSAPSAEVSVCVGHGQNDRSSTRRGSRTLSSETDSEDSFDSRHAQHHRKDSLVPFCGAANL